MKNDYEMLVFSDEWDGLPFSCRHLLSHFLPEVRLLWVETIGLRPPGLSLYDARRALQKMWGWLAASPWRRPGLPQNLTRLDLFQIPYNHLGLVRRFNTRVALRALQRFPPGLSGSDRVLFTTWPFLGGLVGRLGERLSVYYRVDDFSEFPGVRGDLVRRLERELIDKVDLVIATAENLTHLEVEGKPVRYLPHGVDFEHFSRVDHPEGRDLPVTRIPLPRIGFFGLISSWVDLELMAHLVQAHRDWSFVFIGPTQISISQLTRLRNFHYLGPVSYQDLPLHARHFDVGIIPFKTNALTRSVNPLKLMEYLSLGMPVVSTPLSEVVKYSEYVEIASDPQQFGRAIQTALSCNNARSRARRQSIAKAHGWKGKATAVKAWIEEALEEKVAVAK